MRGCVNTKLLLAGVTVAVLAAAIFALLARDGQRASLLVPPTAPLTGSAVQAEDAPEVILPEGGPPDPAAVRASMEAAESAAEKAALAAAQQ
jgi:hypothetical protein